MKKLLVSVAFIIAGAAAVYAQAASLDKVKQDAQAYLSQSQQQSQQNATDYSARNDASIGNAANERFTLHKQRIDAQAAIVAQEKAKIDEIVSAGHVVKPSEFSVYQKAIDEYNSRVKELEAWLNSNK
ncbi:MAG: hypothetical protein LBG76_00125 [Treponema sp.]|jgi:uncharacterized protein (DUF1800 family)|nr:hypothetical protein [Treponema sp.]